MVDPTPQVCESTTLTDEVIHQGVFASCLQFSGKAGLTSEADVTARTRMRNNVRLNDGRFGRQAKSCAEQSCQRNRDCIDATPLMSMRTHVRRQAMLAGIVER